MNIWPAICLSTVFAAAPAFAQREFSISGTVVNSVTGAPVAGALVHAQGLPMKDGESRRTAVLLTEADGVFRIAGLPAAKYVLTVQKPGYKEVFTESRESVEIGPSRDGVVLKLAPYAKITGQVVERDGAPVVGANIRAFRSDNIDGRRVVRQSRSVATDSLGRFRVWNLEPGDYYLLAAGRGGGTALVIGHTAAFVNSHESFAPVYFGGASDRASAAPITLAAGQEFEANLTVTMRRAYRVRGRIQNASAYQQARIELLRGGHDVSATRAMVNAANGEFELQDVVPGAYTVRATQGSADAERRGEAGIVVGEGDVDGVGIALAAPVDVTATVKLTTGKAAFAQITLQPEEEGDAIESLREGDVIAAKRVFPGRYRVMVETYGGYATSVMAGNQDLLNAPILTVPPGQAAPAIEIVIDPQGGTLQGRSVAAAGSEVLLVPSGGGEPFTTPAPMGSFELANIAPGDYRLYLLPQDHRIEYRNPEAVRRLSGGVPVHVEKGATVNIELKEFAK